MTEIYPKETKSLQFIAITLILQFSLLLVTFFDIPFARQTIGFFYLTFIPGYVALNLLNPNKLTIIEKLLFSVGLSIVLLMLIGLVINELGSIFGIQKPLALMPLVLTISSLVIFGTIFHYLKNTENQHLINPSTKTVLIALLLVVIPVLSVMGALWVNIFDSNIILLFVIPILAMLMAVSIISKKFLKPTLYPIIILSIALSLLFHSSLITSYIHGYDSPVEYAVFSSTQDSGFWNKNAYFGDLTYGRFNGMLSVTVLPVFYSNVLNMDGTWVFKIIFPLVFSLVPLGLYELWRHNLGKKTSLVASFLFISQNTFYTEMLGLNRQMIGELFFVLLLLLIFSKKLETSAVAKFLFAVFSFGLIVSHYATALLFLFLIGCVWAFSLIRRKLSQSQVSLILLFSGMLFFWYVFTSSSGPFESILSVGKMVLRNIGEFFNPESRGSEVLLGLGMIAPRFPLQLVSRAFAYIIQLFIIVGFVAVTSLSLRAKLARSMDKTYFLFSLLAIIILAMCIIVPMFALTLNMTRFYHLTLFFLAPLFVVGCKALAIFLSKRRFQLIVSLLAVIVIIPYFLFQTNYVYEVSGSESWSVPLSKYRLHKIFYY
ncbi:MAG: DUF2206 domain-containing protein, partial [Candidatus Jordarchaeaceae archaeon]